MQTKKIGAIALAGTAFGTVVSPAFAPLAGAQTEPATVTANAEGDPAPTCGSGFVGRYPDCVAINNLLLLSLIVGALQALLTLVAP